MILCKSLYKEGIAQFNLVLTRKILLVRERNIRLITPDVNLCLDSSIVIYAGGTLRGTNSKVGKWNQWVKYSNIRKSCVK